MRVRLSLIVLVIFFVLPLVWAEDDASFFAFTLKQLPEELWKEYRDLNEKENWYAEYRDSDQMLAVKLVQLVYINKSRARYKAPPVRLDILASRVANRMCREASENNFRGHWNMRGEKPYHRYAFAGGLDHVSENASSRWSSAPFEKTLSNYVIFMAKGHDQFMAEQAPNDGHKRNCIDKEHNYVGLGAYIHNNQFRYYEEFIDRHLEFVSVKTAAQVGESFSIKVKPLRRDQFVYALIAYFEDFPRPMTPAQINGKGSYPDFTSNQAVSLWP
ncbi:MAG TPA: CAP domain-containing protein, partial [Spirochaetia bacterium]|nr:CAP domain-containing protein [Spirochaetia bacterium]